jgi:hypothetical protein
MPTHFFANGNMNTTEAKARPGLRLMLWAGDGKHAGVTDIKRLPDYDVYLCAGWQEHLEENIASLSDTQTLCILDVHNELQLEAFHRMYDGCFAQIDSDYHGNTPSLSLADYSALLMQDGTATNIEAVSSLIMPYENFYGLLELFAPILPDDILLKRRWCPEIMELSRRDTLPPEMVWTSPDLDHPYYSNVKAWQLQFEERMKQRSAAWPRYKATLQEHWASLETHALVSSPRLHMHDGDLLLQLVVPHMIRFNEFLEGRIESLLSATKGSFILIRADYMNEKNNVYDDSLRTVILKQTVLKLLMKKMPPGLWGMIGCHADTRFPDKRPRFGLKLIKGVAPVPA